MRLISKVIPLAACVALVGCGSSAGVKPTPSAKKVTSPWVCTAESLIGFSYSGGSTANIHLSAYDNGGDYSVKLNSDKTVATGVTADDTPFTCTKK